MKKFFYSDISLGPLWCLGGAFLLSLCWLLPNVARPWTSFHADAATACVLILISLVVFLKGGEVVSLPMLPLVVLAASLFPLIQYAFGILPFSGQAWISASYMLGFALAILTGQQWQRQSPLWMERVVFVAFLLAGVVSVFLALYQWLRLGESDSLTDIWVVPYSIHRGRPYANLGQPNQLATLLLWSLLACAWMAYRRYLSMLGGIFVAGLLLVGLALTQSRSGMAGVVTAVVLCWIWRRLINRPAFFYCVAGLLIGYAILLVILPYLGKLLFLETELSFVERTVKESRLSMWRMALDSVSFRPWTGYGWNQVLPGQLAVSERYPELAGRYVAQSHNLFLDFIVWTGYPAGLLLICFVLAWIWRAFTRVNDVSQVLYFTIIATAGVHAMVELPLHYAYFLLPLGLVMGSLNASMDIWRRVATGRKYALGLWFLAASLLGLNIRDYFLLERAYTDIRFVKANFSNAPKPHIPETLVLNHLQYVIELFEMTPRSGLNADVVQRYVDTTISLPSAYNISKLIVVLALNKQPDSARFWMGKAKSMMSPENYENAKKDWVRAAEQFPEIGETLRLPP